MRTKGSKNGVTTGTPFTFRLKNENVLFLKSQDNQSKYINDLIEFVKFHDKYRYEFEAWRRYK